jgi:hypothetical protein
MFRSTQARSVDNEGASDVNCSAGLGNICGIEGAIVSSMFDGGKLINGSG